MKLFKNKKVKRLLSSSFVFLILFTTFLGSGSNKVYAETSPTTIQNAYIAMMQGSQTTDSRITALASLDDLRLLSLFLSNGYIPFMSCLDGEDSENSKKVQESFLVNLGFDPDTAKQTVSQVYSASLNSARQLYVEYDDIPMSDDSDYRKIGIGLRGGDGLSADFVTSGGSTVDTTIADENYKKYTRTGTDEYNKGYTPFTFFMFWFLQHTQGEALSNYTDLGINEHGYYYTSVESNAYNYAEWFRDDTLKLVYFDDSGNKVDCFTLDKDMLNIITLIVKNLEMYYDARNKPLGNALYLNKNYSSGNKTEDFDATTMELCTNTIMFQNLYVDWVGNIIVDCGSSRRVLVPACLNKMAFQSISGDSKVNGVSLPFIELTSLQGCNVSDEAVTFSSESIAPKVPIYMDTQTASKGISFDSSFWPSTGADGQFALVMQKAGLNANEGQNEVGDYINFYLHDSNGGISMKTKALKANSLWKSGTFEEVEFNISGAKADPSTRYINVKFDKNNTFSDFLIFKSVKSSQDTDKSSILKGDIFSSGIVGSCFSKSSKSFNSDKIDLLNLAHVNGESDKVMLQNIYLTYIYAYCNKDTAERAFNEINHVVDMKFNDDIFPTLSGTLTWEVADTLQDKVMSLVYYLLHPTEGVDYAATLIKNKMSGFVINSHEDMVGSTDSNYTTGMTQYLGFTGYTTVPSLKDIGWVAGLLDSYNVVVVFLIVLMCLILLCYVITGSLSPARGVIGLIIFAFLAFIPPVAISATVDTTNKVSEAIYSSKFDYWALNQTQGYLLELQKLESIDLNSENGTADYISFLMSQGSIASSGEGGEAETSYAGVKVKWMSPKKVTETAKLYSEIDNHINSTNSGLTSFTSIVISNSAKKNTAKEIYVASDSATYLYRDYMDIYRYASCTYNLFSTFRFGETYADLPKIYKRTRSGVSDNNSYSFDWSKTYRDGVALSERIKTGSGSNLFSYISSNISSYRPSLNDAIRETSSIDAISRGFLVDTAKGSEYYSKQGSLANTLLLSHTLCIEEVAENRENLRDLEENNFVLAKTNISPGGTFVKNTYGSKYGCPMTNTYFGLSNRYFTLGIDDFISEGMSKSIDKIADLSTQLGATVDGLYYSLYTESPFYFLNYNVRDQLNSLDGSNYVYNYKLLTESTGNLVNMLVDDNQSYFFNLSENAGDGYGELRDFMNMHDFFYYIIPVLRVGNDVVNVFDDLYGMTYNPDSKMLFSADGDFRYVLENGTVITSKSSIPWDDMTEEERYDFWHTLNVRTIFNSYTPWLNFMYACSYADAETITVMGEKFVVKDPLDPTTYFRTDDKGNMVEGRYMVFSRSEMKYYGLSEKDLTTVERKIIDMQNNVYNASLDLMNYFTYSDETLIHAYSMIQLFEFNKIFSETSIVGDSYTLYPQSYELKAFTYDAYLRLILSNAGGDELQYSEPSYSGANANKSIYTRIMEKTSLFFGAFLLGNDVLAVYVIPALRLFFIIAIFLLSIIMIVASATKMEMNFMTVFWKSLLSPLLAFGGTSIALAFIVSLFMSDGASGVTRTTSPTISLGDPTMTLIVMLVLNIAVVIIYFKICRKLFKDLKTYTKAVFDNVGSTVAGTFNKLAKTALAGGAIGAVCRKLGNISKNTKNMASTAEQRGKDNAPSSGKAGLGTSVKAEENERGSSKDNNIVQAEKGTNKYDKKVLDKANARTQKAQDKFDKAEHKMNMAATKGASKEKQEKLLNKAVKAESKMRAKKQFAENVAKGGRGFARKEKAKEIGSSVKKTAGKGFNSMKKAGKCVASSAKKAGIVAKTNAVKASASIKSGAVKAKATAQRAGGAIKRGYLKSADAVKKVPKEMRRGVGRFGGHAINTAEAGKRMAIRGATKAKKGIVNAPKNIKAGALKTKDAVVRAKDSSMQAVKGALDTAKTKSKEGIRFAAGATKNGFRNAKTRVTEGIDNAKVGVRNTYNKSKEGLQRVKDATIEGAKNAYETSKEGVKIAYTKSKEGLHNAGVAINDGAKKALDNTQERVKEWGGDVKEGYNEVRKR